MSKYIKLKDAIEYACKAHISGCVGDRIRAQLQSLPTIEVSEDAISRQGLINTLNARHIKYNAYVNEAILNAPSVVPSRAEGEWIDGGLYDKCSVCGGHEPYRYLSNFCPHCGADMRGGKE